MRKQAQISCAVIAQLISAFVVAARIVQFLLYLSLKFQDIDFCCDCTGRFVSDLVGNPNCWFLRIWAHFFSNSFQDDIYSLFFVNNNWYLFFRLHQLLVERLHTIYLHSQKIAEEEALCRKDRKESTAIALRLKAPSMWFIYFYKLSVDKLPLM